MHQNVANDSDGDSILSMKLCVKQEIVVGLILSLLNDENSVIRQHAISLAEAYGQALASQGFEENVVQCFSGEQA